MSLRSLADGTLDGLHPVSELQHPIVRKATECFGQDGADDNFVGPIQSSKKLRLLEIKTGQWRGGVWEDPETGVRWLVVAGLAKGNHEDRDDFYKRVQRENDNDTVERWLPTDRDQRLLKLETANRLLMEWELDIQDQVLSALREIHVGGSTRFNIDHPFPGKGRLATMTLEVAPVRDDALEADEIVLEVDLVRMYASAQLAWQLAKRMLISLSPPEQDWDRYGDSYSNIAEPGAWSIRVTELEALVADRELAESEPGRFSHYAHRKSLAGSTIEGRGVRALCGRYFVPVQDHERFPVCPECEWHYSALPH